MSSSDRFDEIFAAANTSKIDLTLDNRTLSSTIALDKIQDRFLDDTRSLDQKHINDLAESIAVLGLIEPIAVDTQFRVLAGGHRKAAIHLLKEQNPEAYSKHFPGNLIPVSVIPFDSEEDPNLALAIETAENEKRRDYTPTEVKALAERLKSAGYKDLKGRPKKGQKPLTPALSVVIGKSIRTVQRHLYGDSKGKNKSTTSVALLNKALHNLQSWQKTKPKTSAQKALAKKLPEILAMLEKSISD